MLCTVQLSRHILQNSIVVPIWYFRWTRWYSSGSEIWDYANKLVDKFDIKRLAFKRSFIQYIACLVLHTTFRHMKFNQEVKIARWDEMTKTWTVETHTGEIYTANILIQATGPFPKPNIPEFKVQQLNCTIVGIHAIVFLSIWTPDSTEHGQVFRPHVALCRVGPSAGPDEEEGCHNWHWCLIRPNHTGNRWKSKGTQGVPANTSMGAIQVWATYYKQKLLHLSLFIYLKLYTCLAETTSITPKHYIILFTSSPG